MTRQEAIDQAVRMVLPDYEVAIDAKNNLTGISEALLAEVKSRYMRLMGIEEQLTLPEIEEPAVPAELPPMGERAHGIVQRMLGKKKSGALKSFYVKG